MSGSEQTKSKYNKLAVEYAKLKSQIPVLKKALDDEKSNQKDWHDKVKERDQTIRKFSQEVDSLTFRNQQLTRRVEVLQADREEMTRLQEASGSRQPSHRPSGQLNGPVYSAVSEELMKKIEENELLHKQAQEKVELYEEKIRELEDGLYTEQVNANQNRTSLQTMTETIEKMRMEKAMVEVKVQNLETDLQEERNNALVREERYRSKMNESSPSGVERTAETISHVEDCSDSGACKDLAELMTKLGQFLKDVTKGLSEWHSYTRQRLQVHSPGSLPSQTDIKLSDYLLGHGPYLEAITRAVQHFEQGLRTLDFTVTENVNSLKGIHTAVRKYVSFLQKITPYSHLSIQEECRTSTCTRNIAASTWAVQQSWRRMVSLFSKVSAYLQILSADPGQEKRYNHRRLVIDLARSLSDLQETMKVLGSKFNSKVTLEHQLPTATSRLKTTNEFIIFALGSVTSAMDKFVQFVSGHMELLGSPIGWLVSSRSPAMQDRTSKETLQGYTTSVLSLASGADKRLVGEDSFSDLLCQVAVLRDKVNHLEQEKEHWMLEAQLLQMKYEKAAQTSSGDTLTDSTTTDRPIRRVYSQRIAELHVQLQLADSESVNSIRECETLQKRLRLGEVEVGQLRDEVNKAGKTNSRLKEDLEQQTTHYQEQQSSMGEHLASMNDKLSQQKDEIDDLKFKVSKKAKSK